VEGLGAAVGDPESKTFCMACFTGKYPTPIRLAEDEPPTRSAARG
jgi:glutamine phosphoribosylpyrophosphate amidotransferase